MENRSKSNLFSADDVVRAWQMMQDAQTITLLTHRNPDGDGVSSCAALSLLLEKHGKKTETVYPSKLEFTVTRQPKNVLINTHTFVPDLIIACDTASYDRLYYPDEFKTIPMINIDHHVSNSVNGTINLVIGGAASTCELIYDLMLQWDATALSKTMVEALLFGLLDDTQVFYTTSTTADTLRTAAELIDRGANLFQLHTELLQNKNPKIIEYWGHVLSNVAYSDSGHAAWAVVRQSDLKSRGLTLSSLVGLSNFLAQISGTDITALFYEDEEGNTKVSLRSKKADVNALAGKFGGGGHVNASGILLDKPIDDVVAQVTQEF